jgi:hypothetical protein
MEAEPTISLGLNTRYGVHDTFRHGLPSIRAQITPNHPVQSPPSHVTLTPQSFRPSQGIAFALRQKMDRAYLSQPRGIPVMKRSGMALDVYDGMLDTIDFEDFLGGMDEKLICVGPAMDTDVVDVHSVMEKLVLGDVV